LKPTTTMAATSSTINFQARLETSTGAVAPDGTYNVSFHLFSASSAVGGTSTDTGCGTDTSCEWTEQYTYNSGAGASDARIRVVNGYLTVNLGSLTAFSGINWNQQQWLTMDIGGTVGSGTITWDGQMSPRLLLTATPYAFQAGGLSVTSGSNTDSLVMTAPASASHTITVPDETGTICTTAGSTACTSVYAPASGGSSYVQLQGTTPGTAQTGNFNITGTGIAGTLQAASLDTASAVALGIGTTNATQINLNQNTVIATGKTLQVKGHSGFGSNGNPSSNIVVNIDETINPSGSNAYGISDILRLNPTTSDAGFHAGIIGQAQTTSGNIQNFTGGLRGVTFFAQHNGTGTLNQGWGANFYVQNTSTGTITDAEGLAISSTSNSGGGAITTNYGIKVADQTAGTTNYALYTGLGAVRLGDNTTIAANKSLTANGAATFADATNSTTAFQVQNASSTNIFTVDTTNTAIVLGNDGTPSALTVRGGAATGTNAAGSNLTFAASNGTGTGGSGDLIFQTAAPAISTPTDDGNDNTGTASSATSLTFSHTVASNANRIIVVGIGTGCGFGSTCAATVSSVTYAGVSLSKLSNVDCTTGAGHCHVELWYLAGSTVATGANNVVVTTSASTSIKAGASSYYNVDPTTPFGTAATATGNGNPSSLNVSSNTNQLVVDVITSDNVINSVSAGQTQRYNVNTNGPIASSTKPGAATTTNMGWSDGSSNYATIGAG